MVSQSSQNYYLGTLTKTPLKVYFAGSTLHVAIKETVLLLSLILQSPSITDSVFTSLIVEAVMIYIPAHEPNTIIVNAVFGIVSLTIWTIKFDRATNF